MKGSEVGLWDSIARRVEVLHKVNKEMKELYIDMTNGSCIVLLSMDILCRGFIYIKFKLLYNLILYLSV